MFVTLAVILALPFILEAFVKIGFTRPRVSRHALFYILTPTTAVLVYASIATLLGHAYITFAGWLMVYVGLTAVSNVKNRVLGEPLVSPDLETARHLFIYPEFYIDYVGAGRVILVFGGFALAVVASNIFEHSFASQQTLMPGWAAWALWLVTWCALLWACAHLISRVFTQEKARAFGMTFDINTDVARFGLFPLMLLYALLLLDRTENPELKQKRKPLQVPENAPDIIAVQAESYFDVNRLYQCIPGDESHAWAPLEALRAAGAQTGTLDVPAWGASTMQSEFSFLTGTDNAKLGIDSINPYQRAAYSGVETIASRLRDEGYHTVCIHPAKKEFFRRSTVIPKLGFDAFIGIEAFDGAERFGPYVADTALATVIERTIADHKANSDKPLFLFTITIESHGPWDSGRLAEWIDEEAATDVDPTGDRSFALFRQHMDHVLALFSRLGPEANLPDNRPRVMGLYGDHLPAFHELFTRHGFDGREVDYILWRSDDPAPTVGPTRVGALGDTLLTTAGLQN
ncbi:MAG: LTA synthase family protein [Alphaproteobacteria bacterium]|nr:LTA synthase family protein [Alphaproteobacteria bacterium]